MLPAIVRVSTDRATASGVIVEFDGSTGEALVLTTERILDRATHVDVVVEHETVLRVEVLAADPVRNIALLRIRCGKELSTIVLANSTSIQPGSEVFAVGFTLRAGDPVDSAKGLISKVWYTPRTDRLEIQTDTRITSSNSGGPLLLKDGRMAGMSVFPTQHLTGVSAIPVSATGISSETLATLLEPMQAGETAPLPEPLVVDGVYTEPDEGYRIDMPPGWRFEAAQATFEPTPFRPVRELLAWDTTSGTYLAVYLQDVPASTTGEFRSDFTINSREGWTDFKILSESVIYRWTVDEKNLIDGYEFSISFTAEDRTYRGIVHWFVVGGELYWVQVYGPSETWDESEAVLQARAALISFTPPNP